MARPEITTVFSKRHFHKASLGAPLSRVMNDRNLLSKAYQEYTFEWVGYQDINFASVVC